MAYHPHPQASEMEARSMFETKYLSTPVALKADGEEGAIEAVFSTFNIVDRGMDVVLPGAIEHGKSIPLVWAHDWSKMIGRGVTDVQPDRAVFKGQLFLNTDAGRQAHET